MIGTSHVKLCMERNVEKFTVLLQVHSDTKVCYEGNTCTEKSVVCENSGKSKVEIFQRIFPSPELDQRET